MRRTIRPCCMSVPNGPCYTAQKMRVNADGSTIQARKRTPSLSITLSAEKARPRRHTGRGQLARTPRQSSSIPDIISPQQLLLLLRFELSDFRLASGSSFVQLVVASVAAVVHHHYIHITYLCFDLRTWVILPDALPRETSLFSTSSVRS